MQLGGKRIDGRHPERERQALQLVRRRPHERGESGEQPFRVVDGYVDLPRGPGLGIELDEDAMADKIGHDWNNRETYDLDDGSVVDW